MDAATSVEVEYKELPAFVKRQLELLADHFGLAEGEARLEVTFRGGRVTRFWTHSGPLPASELSDGDPVALS